MNGKPESRNIGLIIGLSIPVVMVLFITVAINGPRWFNTVEPANFDFLYTNGPHQQHYTFAVEDRSLVIKRTDDSAAGNTTDSPDLHFFVHDVSENRSREITLAQAQALLLDHRHRSPDGFTIKPGRRGGWFIFDYGRDYQSRYLVKDNYSLKLDLENGVHNYSYYWNFRFLGWITYEQ